jgi:hypothetical protein
LTSLECNFWRVDFICWPCDLTTKSEKPVRWTWGQTRKICSTLLKICLTAVEPRLNSSSTKSRSNVEPYFWLCDCRFLPFIRPRRLNLQIK